MLPKALVPITLLSTLAIGCAEGVPPGGSQDTDGTGLLADGVLWCARVEESDQSSPHALVPPGPSSVPIFEPGSNPPETPEGCACADNFDGSESTHARLVAMLSGGNAFVAPSTISSGDEDLILFRDIVYNKARARCLEILDTDPQFEDWISSDCLTLIDDTDDASTPWLVNPIYQASGLNTCSTAALFEQDGFPLPSDGYADYYTLSSVVQRVGTGAYEIDDDFFADMLDNPAWLLDDGGRVVPRTPAGWKLDGITNPSILWSLGLRDGDIPRTLNSYQLGSWTDAIAAYDALKSATQFSFEFDRPGTGVLTYTYEVVP